MDFEEGSKGERDGVNIKRENSRDKGEIVPFKGSMLSF